MLGWLDDASPPALSDNLVELVLWLDALLALPASLRPPPPPPPFSLLTFLVLNSTNAKPLPMLVAGSRTTRTASSPPSCL